MKEILIKLIFIDNTTSIVTPVGCPKAEDNEVLKLDGKPCCVYNGQPCIYLDSVAFEKDVSRTLFCKGV